jgi:hypothetical protein
MIFTSRVVAIVFLIGMIDAHIDPRLTIGVFAIAAILHA